MDLLTAVFIVAILLLSLCVFLRKDSRLPPGPYEYPLIGDVRFLLTPGVGTPYIRHLVKKHGKIFTARVGLIRFVFLNDLSTIHEAFVKSADIFSDRPNFLRVAAAERLVFDYGIISSGGRLNKDLRKIALSTMRDMGVGKLTLEERIVEEFDFMSAMIEQNGGQPTNYTNLIQNAVSNIICSIVFGQRFDYSDERFTNILNTVQQHFSVKPLGLVELAVPKSIFSSRLWTSLDPKIQCVANIFRTYRTFLKSLVDEHRQTFDANNVRDFVDVYLKEEQLQAAESSSGWKFNEGHLLHSIVDLFLAGTETTSTTLLWSLLYMLHHRSVLERVQTEIDSVVGRNRMPSVRDRPNMPYTDAVVHEVQRLANIATSSIAHLCAKDTTIGGYFIPKNSIVFANLSAVHLNEQYWPEAEKFIPERWIGADGKFQRQEAFVPFSAGRRICLGEQLARMELFLFFTALVQRFDIQKAAPDQPAPPLDATVIVTRMPKPFLVRLQRRV